MSNLDRFSPYALAALRIITALLFMQHGMQKLLGFPGTPPEGMPSFGSLIWMAGALELAGGALLLVGLFTRAVAFIVSGEMAVAYFMAHTPHSFFPVLNQGDLAVLFCFVFLMFVFTGAGPVSIDGAFKKAV